METTGSRYEQQSVQAYARALRPQLPPHVFEKTPRRLIWLPVHLLVISAAAVVVLQGAPFWIALLCAIVAGHSWGCLGFLAHETLHHAVTRRASAPGGHDAVAPDAGTRGRLRGGRALRRGGGGGRSGRGAGAGATGRRHGLRHDL